MSVIGACPWQRTRLVSDDVTVISATAAGLTAAAPDAIKGLIEVRHLGPLDVPVINQVTVRGAIQVNREPVARVQETDFWTLSEFGQRLPLCHFDSRLVDDPSANMHLRLVLRAILTGQIPI